MLKFYVTILTDVSFTAICEVGDQSALTVLCFDAILFAVVKCVNPTT